jgi:hypothetical protein
LLSVWTVYDHPSDYPDGFVARRHEAYTDHSVVATADAVFAPTLEAVRAKLPPGLHCITRSPGDDPVIVESWI